MQLNAVWFKSHGFSPSGKGSVPAAHHHPKTYRVPPRGSRFVSPGRKAWFYAIGKGVPN